MLRPANGLVHGCSMQFFFSICIFISICICEYQRRHFTWVCSKSLPWMWFILFKNMKHNEGVRLDFFLRAQAQIELTQQACCTRGPWWPFCMAHMSSVWILCKQCSGVFKVSGHFGLQSILDPEPCTRSWRTMPCSKPFSTKVPLHCLNMTRTKSLDIRAGRPPLPEENNTNLVVCLGPGSFKWWSGPIYSLKERR